MTQLTLDVLPYITAPIAERDLRPPENTAEYIEPVVYHDEEKTFFQFKLRSSSFCNQYLLVAETEREDSSNLLHADSESRIRELQKSVNSGFMGV